MPNALNYMKNPVLFGAYSAISGTSTTITLNGNTGKRIVIDSMELNDLVSTGAVTVCTITGAATIYLRTFADGDFSIQGPIVNDEVAADGTDDVTVVFTNATSTAGQVSVSYHYQGE